MITKEEAQQWILEWSDLGYIVLVQDDCGQWQRRVMSESLNLLLFRIPDWQDELWEDDQEFMWKGFHVPLAFADDQAYEWFCYSTMMAHDYPFVLKWDPNETFYIRFGSDPSLWDVNWTF